MKRTIARLVVLGVATSIAAGVGAAKANAFKTVEVKGGVEVSPGHYIADTLHFEPFSISVHRGAWVLWKNAAREQTAHTITVVKKKNVPQTKHEVTHCRICALALGHLQNPSDPEHSGIKTLRLNRGKAGFNEQGDSLLLLPHSSIGVHITARAGRTLHYICAIHPWMQGEIHVLAARATPVTGKH